MRADAVHGHCCLQALLRVWRADWRTWLVPLTVLLAVLAVGIWAVDSSSSAQRNIRLQAAQIAAQDKVHMQVQ